MAKVEQDLLKEIIKELREIKEVLKSKQETGDWDDDDEDEDRDKDDDKDVEIDRGNED